MGPQLALTKILACLDRGLVGDATGLVDLDQLRSLCDAADRDAFTPFTAEQQSDQVVPNAIVQLTELVRRVIAEAKGRDVINHDGLRATHHWRRAGTCLRLGGPKAIGAWFGVDYGAWRKFGRTPIWLRFENDKFSRANAIRAAAHHHGAHCRRVVVDVDEQVLVGVDVASAQERDVVTARIVEQLAQLARALVGFTAAGAVESAAAED